MDFLGILAPRFSKRRLILSILRDFYRRPGSVFGRLASINFANYRSSRSLDINCNVCGSHGALSYDFPDVNKRRAHSIGLLRETLRCKSCAATMRDRQMAYGILNELEVRFGQKISDLAAFQNPPPRTLRILDSDSFSPINRILRGIPGYQHSQFIPNLKNGHRLSDGSIVVDLEDIPFPDCSFDVILTSDVMEHVINDTAAHHSIYRVLDNGGVYIFTVPYDPTTTGNRNLTARTDCSGTASHLFLERHIHGDPHSGSGIVAHRIYGNQLLEDLTQIGFEIDFLEINEPKHGIFRGDLFIARKGN